MAQPLIQFTERGMYCPLGDFYIDPWRPVSKALITHAHADHARWGMKQYMATDITSDIMHHRISKELQIQKVKFSQKISVNGVQVSFHPAGHIPGSAQIRLEHRGEVCVAAGDFKLTQDSISESFEPIQCHTFITESTFGLPIFKWKTEAELKSELTQMIAQNEANGFNTLLLGYSLGKAQRLLKLLDFYQKPILLHGAVANITELIEQSTENSFPDWKRVTRETELKPGPSVIIAPPNAQGSAWTKKFRPFKTIMASGWMNLRGARRRRNVDMGLVLSDHADFNELIRATQLANPDQVIVTHGYSEVFSRHLNELGYRAISEKTAFEGEVDDDSEEKLEGGE